MSNAERKAELIALVCGAHLFENGDLVVNIDKRGMARVDACGKIIWLNESLAHHSIDVDDDGFIWAPRGPVSYSNKWLFPHPFVIDEIARIDPATGETLEVISLGDVLVNSEEPALLTSGSMVLPDILHVTTSKSSIGRTRRRFRSLPLATS